MNSVSRLVLALALLAAAAVPALAQNPTSRPQERQQQGNVHGRIQEILSRRQELSLDSEQVAQLQRIARELQEKNAPIQRRIRELQGEQEGGAQARAQLRERPELRPLVEQMRSNNQEAVRRVRRVLTAEQMERAEQHFRSAGSGRRDNPPPNRP